MMKLNTFDVIKESRTDILEGINLGDQYCGLFRCPLLHATKVMPDMSPLFTDAIAMLIEMGYKPSEWELDLKIHMLMENQYPCIPNWHCDNVPRVDGEVDYSLIKKDTPPMFLWLSDSPTTEFLKQDYILSFVEESNMSHGKLAECIKDYQLETEKLPSKTWISMDQRTPHRGTKTDKKGWRVFMRLTHKSITPVRPVNSYIRRHCQVYLDSNTFSW